MGEITIIIISLGADGILSVNNEEHLCKGEQNNSNRQQEGHETLHDVENATQKHSEIDLRTFQEIDDSQPQNTFRKGDSGTE
jgi:hypothetical protein